MTADSAKAPSGTKDAPRGVVSPLRFLLISLVLAIAGAGGYWFWQGGDDGGGSAGEQAQRQFRPTPVVVTAPAPRVFTDRIEALGTAEANESVAITATVTERVARIAFVEGMEVSAGDILVELASTEEFAQLEQARARAAETEQAYQRALDLTRSGTQSQSRLEQATANRNVARAQVEALEARLSDFILRAPFDGVVGLRLVSPGTLVRPTDQITTLDDVSVIKVSFSIPEKFMSALSPGLEIVASAAAFADEPFTGVITVVDTRVDPVTRAVTVRAEIPNEDGRLKPGMLLSLAVLSNTQTSLSLPEESLVAFGEQMYVFRIVQQNRVQRVPVETGRRRPGYVEILGGLAPDDLIVVEGTNRVRNRGMVEIIDTRGVPAEEAPDGRVEAQARP